LEEANRHGCDALGTIDIDVLYRVTDTLYASREYAKHHMDIRLRQYKY
jgi:hypothetical protein